MKLDDYFQAMRIDKSKQLLDKCYREHSRLAHKMGKYGSVEGSYEGYLYEAIPLAVIEWDETKGNACTCLFRVAQRLIQRDRRDQCYKGAVRVPYGRKDCYEGCEFENWYSGILEEESEAD